MKKNSLLLLGIAALLALLMLVPGCQMETLDPVTETAIEQDAALNTADSSRALTAETVLASLVVERGDTVLPTDLVNTEWIGSTPRDEVAVFTFGQNNVLCVFVDEGTNPTYAYKYDGISSGVVGGTTGPGEFTISGSGTNWTMTFSNFYYFHPDPVYFYFKGYITKTE
jgi:hypothetical protein